MRRSMREGWRLPRRGVVARATGLVAGAVAAVTAARAGISTRMGDQRQGTDASRQRSPAIDPARTPRSGDAQSLFTLYTFGDSILDCRWHNDYGLDPGQLLVRNHDHLFPEFQGQDLSSSGPVRLAHRTMDGATVADLPRQGVAILTVGGNDLLRGLLIDRGPGIDAFAAALDAFVHDFPLRPVLIGNVYDPTFGDDTLNFTGVEPALVRENHRRLNAAIAEVAGRYGRLVDLHAHFLTGDLSWCTRTIEPSLRGASEVRRCFLPYLLAAQRRAT